MTSEVISQHCFSAGSILLSTNIRSSAVPTSAQYYSGSDMLVFISEEKETRSETSPIPAAPFDSPSTVSLFSQVSEPVQPRRTIFVQDLGDARLSLRASIPVALDFWRDSVTACCYDLEDFGVGEDEFSALSDLKASLVELYFVLKANADRLGPLPERHWNYLRSITREI